MNRLSYQLTFLLLAMGTIAPAQDQPAFLPDVSQQTPDWVRYLYSENPNVRRLDSLYEAYYRAHPFEKTTHTQYYKRWRLAVEPFVTAHGQVQRPTPDDRARQRERHLAKRASAKSTTLWECLGPYETRSTGQGQTEVSWQANVYTLDQSPSQPDILYAGTEAGGIFKTTDRGLNWTFVSANTFMRTVRAVKVHPTDPDIVFAGAGDELYRSLDGGQSWTLLVGYGTGAVNDLSINPADPQIVLAATTNGLRRSTDGGLTWTTLYTDPVYDIELQPDDPAMVFILKNNPTAQRCEFLKSTDYGQTFSLRDQGWFNGSDPGRADYGARMTVTEADPGRIYAILIGQAKAGDNGYIGVYRSDDAGESWLLPNPPAGGPYSTQHPNLASFQPDGSGFHQGYYNLSIAADDQDPDRLLIGALSLWKSEDGAQSFTALGGYQGNVPWVHPDVQEIEINGPDVWVATDGGIDYSDDFFAGKTSRKYGITASDYWGFDSGWNEDVLVGGRYHNGNSGFYETYPAGASLRLGGAESPTGYVNPGDNRRVYFSDIGGRILPDTYEGAVGSFSVGLFPTESYFSLHSSELTFDPRYYGHLYLGSENKLWRSTDGGRSFEAVHAFGNDNWRVLKIEIGRSNPDVLYVTVDPGSGNNGYLFRSLNGGQNWTPLPIPSGFSRRMQISLSATDADRLWLGYRNGADGDKVFRTDDGGLTWENLTTPFLDGERVHDLLHAGGTEGGVYLGTDQAVYYRNESMPDWQLYSAGLPLATSTNLLRPFYRDAKLRLGAYGRGLWQADLAEDFSPVAQPMVDKAVSFCTRDTFFFEDHSILRHAGAAWLWSFPGAAYVSDPQARNPRVVYDSPGSYDVTLTVTQINGQSDTRTVPAMVTVSDGCEPDPRPGLALDLSGATPDYAVGGPPQLSSNTVTFSAWIRPDGQQNPWAGLIFCRGGTTTAGLNFGENQELRYHWNGGEWWWNPGLTVPAGQWSHVALVVEPNRATLYLNGAPAVHNVPHEAEAFDADLFLGADPNFATRRFRGLMDEVCLYRRALSTTEVRELMHLTRAPADDPDLAAYYQFNRPQGEIADRAGVAHLSLAGTAGRTASTAPVGPGVSRRLAGGTTGDYVFPEVGLRLSFPVGGAPPGDLVATRLDRYPDVLPAPVSVAPAYWILHHFGPDGSFAEPEEITFQSVGRIHSVEGWIADRLFQLHRRPATADGDTWASGFTPAAGAEPGPEGALRFGGGNGIDGRNQLVLIRTELEAETAGDFKVSGVSREAVLLSWQYPPEPGLTGYRVERRGEREADFSPIGYLPAGKEGAFTFRDEAPLPGTTEYRLKRMYGERAPEISPVRTAWLNLPATSLLVFPNPLPKGESLQLQSSLEGPFDFYLYDANGRLVLQKNLEGPARLDLSYLAPGPYFYYADHPRWRFHGRVILQAAD